MDEVYERPCEDACLRETAFKADDLAVYNSLPLMPSLMLLFT